MMNAEDIANKITDNINKASVFVDSDGTVTLNVAGIELKGTYKCKCKVGGNICLDISNDDIEEAIASINSELHEINSRIYRLENYARLNLKK